MTEIAVQSATTEPGFHEAKYYGFKKFGCQNYRSCQLYTYLIMTPTGTDRKTFTAQIRNNHHEQDLINEKTGFRKIETALRWLIKNGLQGGS